MSQEQEDYLERLRSLEVPMVDSVEKDRLNDFPHYNLRYYEDKYVVDFHTRKTNSQEFEDVLVRVHSNKLLLLALAEGNSIAQTGKAVVEVDFFVNNKDRSKIKTRGKRKLDAKQLHPDTFLCRVRLEGETDFRYVRAGIRAYLVETNDLLKETPGLLTEDPKGLGYIGIAMPAGSRDNLEQAVENMGLLTEEEYLEVVASRKPKEDGKTVEMVKL